jgi:hypothetical protein
VLGGSKITTAREGAMSEDSSMRLLEKELDRQGQQIIDHRKATREELEQLQGEVKELPALRREVQMLSDTVKSNTQVMYILVGLLISSGALGALLKGVL